MAPARRFSPTAWTGRVVQWSGKQIQREWQFPGLVVRLAVFPDGRHLFLGNRNDTTYVLDLKPGGDGK
jgi:hypothetical protein